jgi:hypothetical protein
MRRNQKLAALTGSAAIAGFAAVSARLAGPALVVVGLVLAAVPGYVWAEVLLGNRCPVLERVLVSASLALALPVIGGVALYFSDIALHQMQWAGLLAGGTITGDVVLLLRPERDRPGRPDMPRRAWRPGQVAMFAIAAVLAAGAVQLARYGAEHQQYPGFTELWLAPQPRKAGVASLGVANRQGTTDSYQLVLRRGDRVVARWRISLRTGQTWQHPVSLRPGLRTTADLFLLPDLARPYRHVALSATVSGTP